jgi:GTP cyclohydrolase FolE2
MRTLCNVNNFIKSKVFTIHLVTKNFESVHQHVAYITEHDEACSQTLPAAS